MCGIAGIVEWREISGDNLADRLDGMLSRLAHRGPDDHGVWLNALHGVALGQRRLAVIDLNPSGHQPMVSSDGRWVIVFNGEIYNYQTLRKRISHVNPEMVFRGSSDTEVLLACIQQWGPRPAIEMTIGMFALALWDKKNRQLTIARDRCGEKPLYFGKFGQSFVFASESKAIRALVRDRLTINHSAVSDYLRFSYVPGAQSIWNEIRVLGPAAMLTLSRADDAAVTPDRYWAPPSGPMPKSEEVDADAALTNRLDAVLSEAVSQQLVSDVPLGAFLSGGVDSSAIVALMQKSQTRPVRTFTIGFAEQEYDEAPYARDVAKHLGTEHTELYVTPNDALAVIPELPKIYDEPFADSSQIPTVLLTRLARRNVTVALSGDGGDELFGGYPRYPLGETLWRRLSSVPYPVRVALYTLLKNISPQLWDDFLALAPSRRVREFNGRRLHKLVKLLRSKSSQGLYLDLASQCHGDELPLLKVLSPSKEVAGWQGAEALIYAMRRWDFDQYLPDDLLVKIDRASMACSLETRSPFLDHRVVEFGMSLPVQSVSGSHKGKWLLKQVLNRYIPSHLIDRPKRGFSVPIAQWLRGPLRPWAEDLLSPQKMAASNLLCATKTNQLWRAHLGGKADNSALLWNILMFQAWINCTE